MPATWATYDEVQASTVGDSFGICLGDGLACLDLDKCLDGEGRLKPWAVDAIRTENVTPIFVEVSVSDEGLHIFYEAPERPGKKDSVGDGRVERYSRGRFILTTGRVFDLGAALG